ncbi:cutinase family protein [Mycolicibacterium moriokaense]|uniref:Cutinase cut2 n=2 Tax=Mycolicibacterium moriokaense TaxID=39691 RepID=A0AAD1HEN4_9MYCO|nr:cutinase family protein [Mycolicibacterium moriokaense]BBX03491.1 putative cutinase cut2 [Mycolicibacterium moriokaense]
MAASATVPVSLIPVASAACPDAEVVFARGRLEPPGVGAIGDALVNALRSKTARSVGVYGVNYVADLDAAEGARDIGAHIRSMARDCPNTRMVVGGYSLGATAADLFARANSLPPDINRHVAAIVLFGNGTRRLGPAPAYADRTIDQCADGDPICGRGLNWDSHLQPSYLGSGLIDQAAGIVAGKL